MTKVSGAWKAVNGLRYRVPSVNPKPEKHLKIARRNVAELAFWVVPAIALFLTPLIFWTGPIGSTMNLGGDDSHFMYAYPMQWLAHAALPPLDLNLSGYNSRAHFVLFTLLLAAIKFIGLNAQGVAFGAILALTYLGIVAATLVILGNRSGQAKAAAVFAGVIAVSAPLLAETQWTTLLTAILWEPLLPWLFVFYVWHQKSGRQPLTLAAAGAVAVAAPGVNQFSWTISCGLLLVSLAIITWIGGVYEFRLKRLLSFALSIGCVNAFWIVPTLAAPFLHQAQISSALSESAKSDALFIVRAIAPLMSAADALTLRNSAALMEAYRWPGLIVDRWPQALTVLGLIPVIVVAVGTSVSAFRQSAINHRRSVFGLGLLTVLFLYFQTLHPFPGGIRLFELLIQVVPGWTAERNFFDKFAIPFVEIFAITAGVCLYQLISRVPVAIVVALTSVLASLLAAYGFPFFAGAEFRLPYYLDASYTRVMTGLPGSYLNMLTALKRLPPGAVLTLPLSGPAWSVVPAEYGNGAYIGISPIFFLTGRSDYNGIGSFASPVVPYLEPIVKDDLERGDMTALARLVGELGVRYVVFATSNDYDHGFYQVPAVGDLLLEESETRTLLSTLAPAVIGQFGPYQLRQVSPLYLKGLFTVESQSSASTSQAFLEGANLGLAYPSSDTRCESVSEIRGVQLGADEYVLTMTAPPSGCSLIFRVPYSADWEASIDSGGGGQAPTRVSSVQFHGFANAFPLPSANDRSVVEISLVYRPRSFALLGAGITLLTVVAMAAWMGQKVFRNRSIGANHRSRAGG